MSDPICIIQSINEREEARMTDPITDPRGIVLLDEGDPRATTCPVCSKSWDDSVPTGWTPAPAGRCPWEYEHPAANDAQGYPWAEKTASDLWSDLLVAVGDSEWLYDAFQSLAVRVGILDECPRCEHTVEVGEPVDPCECCEGDDE